MPDDTTLRESFQKPVELLAPAGEAWADSPGLVFVEAVDSEEPYSDVPSEASDGDRGNTAVPSDEHDNRPHPPQCSAEIALMEPRMPEAVALAGESVGDGPTRGQLIARGSHIAPSNVPLKPDGRLSVLNICAKMSHDSKGPRHETSADREDRQRQPGTVGRLVHYASGMSPSDDITGLAFSENGSVFVTAVKRMGPAAVAGVIAGDQLVSIDGEKLSAKGRTADDILRGLVVPVTLVFMGSVSKLAAEFRVKHITPVRCGLSPGNDVTTISAGTASGQLEGASPTGSVCEPIVFQPSDTSILIETSISQEGALARPCIYELRRDDARHLVHRALRRSRNLDANM